MSRFLSTAYRSVEKFLGPHVAAEIGVRFFGYDWAYSRHHIFQFHKSSNPQADLLSDENFAKSIYEIYGGAKPASDVIPDPDLASARSYVPFRRNETSFILYNYFRRHHGIRDPILFRLVFLKEG